MLEKDLRGSKLVLVLGNMVLFAVFLCFYFYKFSPGYWGVWSQLLLASIYPIILSELITNNYVRRMVDIVGYGVLSILWLSVLVGVSGV